MLSYCDQKLIVSNTLNYVRAVSAKLTIFPFSVVWTKVRSLKKTQIVSRAEKEQAPHVVVSCTGMAWGCQKSTPRLADSSCLVWIWSGRVWLNSFVSIALKLHWLREIAEWTSRTALVTWHWAIFTVDQTGGEVEGGYKKTNTERLMFQRLAKSITRFLW